MVRQGVQGVGAEGVASDIRVEGDAFVISLLGVASLGWGVFVFLRGEAIERTMIFND